MTEALTRPDRDEELRLEAASRALGGPQAYPGRRECDTCHRNVVPAHADGWSDYQECPHCLLGLPEPWVTWMIRPHGNRDWLILRQGDRCAIVPAPILSGDDDVDRVLAGDAWINLEYQLGLISLQQSVEPHG